MKDYPDYPVAPAGSIPQLFRRCVEQFGPRTAFERTDGQMTYRQLEAAVLRVAGSIPERNRFIHIRAADPVLFAIGYFAAVLTGNAAVLIDTDRCPEEAQLPPAALTLTDSRIRCRMEAAAAGYETLPEADPERVCTVVYSSGTSSAAKGVMLSQKNLCRNIVSGLEKYRFTPEDRLLQLIPYHHAFGLVCDLLAPLYAGAAVCVPDSRAQALAQMGTFRPTMLNAPPAVAQALLALARRTGSMDMITGGRLKKILCGGAGLRAEITTELLQWGIKALGCYGVSECSPCVSVNRDDYYKPGSAGIPLRCNGIRIAGDGEILIRGDNVMLGYYGDPERTARVIRDGEYHTGDLGYLDSDGFLFVTGRKSSLIVFEDGTKCLPEVLEARILEHPAVQEAIVFARESGGRRSLCARVCVPQTELQEEVRQYLLRLPSRQPIARIEFTSEPLPKTSTGKLRRNS